MPLPWTAFHAAHGHPYILFVDLLEARRRQSRFTLLGSLAGALNLKGDYALLPEKEMIRIVFERESDAAALARALLARRTAARAAGPGSGRWCWTTTWKPRSGRCCRPLDVAARDHALAREGAAVDHHADLGSPPFSMRITP